MKPIILRTALAGVAATGFIGLATCLDWFAVTDVYDKLRGSLFTGFFTLSGFLLSIKTFTIVNMKTGVYDQEHYRFLHIRRFRDQPLYERLGKLATLLHWSVVFALTTSLVQITVGLIKSPIAVAFCFALAGATAALLGECLSHLRTNLKAWFTTLDEHWAKARPGVEAEMKKQDEAAINGEQPLRR